ncbi:MAG: uroporphyrinogen decarboxylase family protein [Planctomycetota bacterium]
MPATSRQIVSDAIHHRGPERLPVLQAGLGVCDSAWLPMKTVVGFQPAVAGEDEWGCIWDRTEIKNMGQIKVHPLLEIPADLAACKRPDYRADSRWLDCPAALDRAEHEGKYVVSGLFMVLFERMQGLHGFENCLMDLKLDRPAMERLANLIVETHLTYVREVHRRFGNRVHGISMSDDWGTQTAAYISSTMWMDFFYPHYRRLFDEMHRCGYDVWVHSCGKVNEIIEGYIAAGVNVVNLQQPRALGISEIGRRYRGRIAFESLCDIQRTLPTGDRRLIAEDADQLMQHWADGSGGFIFSDYGDGAAIGAPAGAKLAMYREFSRLSERLYGRALPEPCAA